MPPYSSTQVRWTHREVYDPAPGGLIVLEVEDLWLIPSPPVCYERYANCTSPEEPTCPHLIDVLQAGPKTAHSLPSLAYRQSGQRQYRMLSSDLTMHTAREHDQRYKQEEKALRPLCSSEPRREALSCWKTSRRKGDHAGGTQSMVYTPNSRSAAWRGQL